MNEPKERFLEIPALRRLAPVKSFDTKTRAVTVMWGAGAQVRRYDWWNDENWIEELDMSREAADLSRLNGGAPVLDTHRRSSVRDDIVGVVEKAWIDNGQGMAEVKFSRRDDVQPLLQDVEDGVVRAVSIGYEVFKYEEMGFDQETGYRIMRAVKWRPFEISFVPIGADAEAGTRARDPSDQATTRCEMVFQPAASAAQQERNMTEAATAAAGASAEQKLTAAEAEKQRRQAIINFSKASKIDPRVEARWIEDGTSLPEVGDEIIKMLEERGKQKPRSAASLGMTDREVRNYSLFKAIRAMRFGAQSPKLMEEAAFELECSRDVAKALGRQQTSSMLIPAEVLSRPVGREAAERAMSVVPGAKGGYMVSIDQMGFIDILRNRSVAMAMGARVLSGLQGNVTFPRQTGKPTVTWQGGEGVSVTAADQTLGQLSMTPKTCIAITDVSEQLLAQASPSAEAFVMADLAADVAIDGVDAASINGTGGAQPLGIKNTTGITSGQDAASATYAKILAFVSTAGGANAILGNPGWVTNTAGAAKLMQVQRFTSTDTPLWVGNMLNGVCVGFNAMSSEQLASGNLIFGSWDQLVIGEWGVLELSMDNGGTRFNQAQVGIRALWMVDILLRYPQAFVVSTNLS